MKSLTVFLALTLYIVLTANPHFLAAQTQSQAPPSLDPCSRPFALLGGMNMNGEALSEIRPSDLIVEVKGHTVPATLGVYRGPKRLLILIDASRTMTYEPKSGPWQMVSMLIKDAIKSASPHTAIAIAFYADSVDHYSGFPSDRDDLLYLFNSIDTEHIFPRHKYNGQLLDAINWSLDALAPTQPGDSIYLITSGKDDLSHASFDETRDHLLRSRVRLFAYLLRPSQPRPFAPETMPGALPSAGPRIGLLEPIAGYTPVVDLARFSGGNIAVETATPNGFVAPLPTHQRLINLAAYTLYREMQTPAQLQLSLPPNLIEPGKTLPLSVAPIAAHTGPREGWQLHYPVSLPVCVAPKP